MKIVLVGGGSYAWAPQFVRDLIAAPGLQGCDIVLHDIDPMPLALVYTLGQKLIADRGSVCRLHQTTDLAEALVDADAVILTITTGGLEAMRADIEIPAKYGIYQSVGDTVGPGGLARGLRNIPVVVDLAASMARYCPDAWLLNYTNPMTTLCRAVTRETSIHTVGLCHEYLGMRQALQQMFDVSDPAAIEARVAGINHLIWIMELKVRGQDVFPRLGESLTSVSELRHGSASDADFPSLVDHRRVKSRLFELFGALPAAGDRHVAEFFPFFLCDAVGRGARYEVTRTTIEERYGWRAAEKAHVELLIANDAERAAFLEQDSGEDAVAIISALNGGAAYTGVINLPNQGQIANLPADVVVETFGVIDANGARGLLAGELPEGVRSIVSRHVSNQELIVEAALIGDKQLALQALVNDPMITVIDDAEAMLDEMLIANRQYLPRFFD